MSTGSEITSTSPKSRPAFIDVDRLTSSAGVVAVISQRTNTGELTFSIFREFPRDGRVDRTGFFPEHMSTAFLDMFKLTIERMRQLRDSKQLPIQIKE